MFAERMSAIVPTCQFTDRAMRWVASLELLLCVVPATVVWILFSGVLVVVGFPLSWFILGAGTVGLFVLWLLVLPAALPGAVVGARHPIPTQGQALALLGGVMAAVASVCFLLMVHVRPMGWWGLVFYAVLAPALPACHYLAVFLGRTQRP